MCRYDYGEVAPFDPKLHLEGNGQLGVPEQIILDQLNSLSSSEYVVQMVGLHSSIYLRQSSYCVALTSQGLCTLWIVGELAMFMKRHQIAGL